MKKTTPPSLLDELEAAIQSGSSERRAEMLARITDLFIDNAPRVIDAQVGVFDDVFEYLIREIESEAVLQLSNRIAPVDNAPERLIRRLAHDDAIEISGPVLARSDRLGEDELVAIARTKSQAHLAAIAGRTQLGEQVTDVLVERGDVTVARKVAANSGRAFPHCRCAIWSTGQATTAISRMRWRGGANCRRRCSAICSRAPPTRCASGWSTPPIRRPPR